MRKAKLVRNDVSCLWGRGGPKNSSDLKSKSDPRRRLPAQGFSVTQCFEHIYWDHCELLFFKVTYSCLFINFPRRFYAYIPLLIAREASASHLLLPRHD